MDEKDKKDKKTSVITTQKAVVWEKMTITVDKRQ